MRTVPLPEQRDAALKRANEIRIKRADLKRDLKAGRVAMADILAAIPSWLANARVYAFILNVPHVGEEKADAILFRSGVPFTWRFRQLTDRQREALTDRLGGPKCDKCRGPIGDRALHGVCKRCIYANAVEWRSKATVLLQEGLSVETVARRVGLKPSTVKGFASELRRGC